MKRKTLVAFTGETGEFGDQSGLTISLNRKVALSLFGVICLILCFLMGLAAIFLLLFSLV